MASEFFSQANAEFVAENYQRSLELYTEAINADNTQDEFFVNRAHANIKVEKYKEAVADADKAIAINYKSKKAFLRKGTALFYLEDFKSAKRQFEEGLVIDGVDDNFKTWIRKCEAELDLEDQPKLGEGQVAVGMSSTAAGADGDRSSQSETMTQPTEAQSANMIGSDEKPKPVSSPAPKIRHDWYQTQTHVIVAVLIKNVKTEDLSVDITELSLHLTVKQASGDDVDLQLNLAHTIVPDQCQTKVLSSKVEVKLKKTEGIQWSKLEGSGQKSDVKQISLLGGAGPSTVPKYPSSSQHSRDWDKLAHDLAEEEKNETPEGDAALNNLFQKIYADGNDEVKKAMVKSFYESGGTVLSTNWNEIGTQKVEVKPPDGMEYKKWDQ